MKWKTAAFGGCYTYVCVEGGNTYRETGVLSRLPKEALYFPRQLQWFHLFFCIAVLLNDSLSCKFLLSDHCALYIRRSANTKKSDTRSCVLQTCLKTPKRICRFTLFVWVLFSCSFCTYKRGFVLCRAPNFTCTRRGIEWIPGCGFASTCPCCIYLYLVHVSDSVFTLQCLNIP